MEDLSKARVAIGSIGISEEKRTPFPIATDLPGSLLAETGLHLPPPRKPGCPMPSPAEGGIRWEMGTHRVSRLRPQLSQRYRFTFKANPSVSAIRSAHHVLPRSPRLPLDVYVTDNYEADTPAYSSAPIAKGAKLPSVPVRIKDMGTEIDLSTQPGKNIIVTVPGAFTPTCHSQVPGYIALADKFKQKGVDGIYVVSVNDQFVMNAWKKDLGGEGVEFTSDSQAKLADALGLGWDVPPLGGTRFQRAVIVVQDGKVVDIKVEPESGKSTVTQAEELLKEL
ncbi:hypothetical protein A1Q2_06087 [Trichosporon asahii var. asahii CBS 8904]|uniref:Thioredoxin domain-containing protein n=1 Tax=Trichosporon asahii var. asahii (strain CBS 8904) TaxID=1220162 RepID=K1WDJ7_TRIAC|nr:hypothetical protein A1Q2_06087 [Trichosporon asahii var. asahii CBS 8904]